MKIDSKNQIWLVSGLLVILALIPRIVDLTGHSAFYDETMWLYRGGYLFDNLFVHFDLNSLQNGWWADHNLVALGLPVAMLVGIFQKLLAVGSPSYSLGIYDLLGASRFPLVIVGALTPAAVYYFMQKLGHAKIGFLAALLIALDPVHVGLSRWAHQDVFLTLSFVVAIFSFLLYEKTEKPLWRNLLITGLVLGFLTKFNMLIALPILLIWKVWKLWHDHDRKWKFKNFVPGLFNRRYGWIVLWSWILVMLLWTGVWTAFPPYTFATYFIKQLGVTATFDHTTFYLGQITSDPAWHYYLIILGIRLTEVTILGFFLGIYIWWKKKRGDIDLWTLLWIWAIVYVVVMSIAHKKLEVRYVLPVYPVIMIFAAWGLLATIRRLLLASSHIHGLKVLGADNFPVILVTVLIVAYNLPILNFYSPSYYLYYNLLAGGTPGAVRYTAIGVDEGLKQAALYAKEHYKKDTKFVLIGSQTPFRYYYNLDDKHLFGNFDEHKKDATVVMVERNRVQRSDSELLEKLEKWGNLSYIVNIAGVDLVYFYEKK